jgi:hypothetical protein
MAQTVGSTDRARNTLTCPGNLSVKISESMGCAIRGGLELFSDFAKLKIPQ